MPTVTLAHGGGGKAMKDLIDDVFVARVRQPAAGAAGGPGAARPRRDWPRDGDRLAFTTDSFVVDPLFFPGGDIGKLAVCGTVNDLAVGGAMPLYLSCAVDHRGGHAGRSAAPGRAARWRARRREAGVEIVTGDTKVVDKGACDKLFITTAGIGVIRAGVRPWRQTRAQPGDVVLVNGVLGDHGAAILGARGDLALETPIVSDCAPLARPDRDAAGGGAGHRASSAIATRGGVATVLNEIAQAAQVAIEIDEAATPIRDGGQRILRNPRPRSALSRQ